MELPFTDNPIVSPDNYSLTKKRTKNFKKINNY